MIDNYFTQYDNVISPKKHIYPNSKDPKFQRSLRQPEYETTVSTIANNIQSDKRRMQTVSNNEENKTQYPSSPGDRTNTQLSYEDIKDLYFAERKKNLLVRKDNSDLKKEIERLKASVEEKDLIILKQKKETQKDTGYLIELEKLLSAYKAKQFKIIMQNEYSTKQVEENKTEVKALSEDNERLKQFQLGMYEISKQYDAINQNIFELLKYIEELFFNLNQCYKEIKNDSLEPLINSKYNTIAEVKNSFDKIISSVMQTMKMKQDEYNYLVTVKEEEISLLMGEIENLNKENALLKEDGKNKLIALNTLKTENNFIKLRDSQALDNYFKEKINKDKKCKEVKSQRFALVSNY